MDSALTITLKVTLRNISPIIWRRFQVPKTMTLRELHSVLQIVMGWGDTHMHSFQLSGVEYGYVDPSSDSKWHDEAQVTVDDIFKKPGDTLRYVYDFRDNWDHEIEFMGPGRNDYLICTEGERACPPEDIGGPTGYERFLHALGDPENDEYESMMNWLDGPYDSEFFDRHKVDENLERWEH